MKSDARMLLSIFLCLLILFISGAAFASEMRFEKPAYGSGRLVLTFASAPLKTMTEIPFSIELTGSSGKVITDARLTISLDMPAMPMPPNHPKAAYEEGAYRGIAVFTMAGAWQVFINIQRPGYDQEQVAFDIEKVIMK